MSAKTTPRRRLWIIARRIAFILVLLVIAIVLRRPLFLGNFAIVDAGRVYRSSQPSGDRLTRTHRDYAIGSVLSLRGGNSTDDFYRDEVSAASRLGIEFFDLPISATQRPSRRELALILSVLDRCQYPLLIHCKWGSDRTGLVSALYRLDKLGDSPEESSREFTIAHGHIPLFGPQRLHEPLDEYADWLRANNRQHSSDEFRRWLRDEYESEGRFSRWPEMRPGPREIRSVASKDGEPH